MRKAIFYALVISLCPIVAMAQADSAVVSEYFKSISHDENRLRQFFTDMPKGGDLHNHLTGSVYAESYFEYAAKDGLWADLSDGKLYQPKDSAKGEEMVRLSNGMADLHKVKAKLTDKWSVRNFTPDKFQYGTDEYFFGTFGLFNKAASNHLVEMMRELRKRAASENVQYLEVMLTSPGINTAKLTDLCGKDFCNDYGSKLADAIAQGEKATGKVLMDVYKVWEKNKAMAEYVSKYVSFIDSIDKESTLPIGTSRAPICRYQGYASRNSDPLVVLAQLYISFKACLQDETKLVGVNIVSAENSEVAMNDNTAHMNMFSILNKELGGKVNCSLHAGELTLGLVKPEAISHHIREAVFVAKAKRIGHGIDIAFERNSISLLDEMRKRQIPVEINLTSNEFILGVKDDVHPFALYRQAGVPIVLSTDDPGILRTNLTQQYVLATMRYGIGYYEIKQIVRNSIRFAFVEDSVKASLLQKVNDEFATFEKSWRKDISTIKTWED